MNELQIFKNDEFGTIRVVEINEEPWFVGMDIALASGYSNPHDALDKYVDDCDKGVTKLDILGNTQHMTIINESGVYSLIFNNKLRKAKKFKRWVTSEVLPVIHMRGMYATDKVIEKVITNPDFGIRLLTELKHERELRVAAQARVEQLTTKVEKDTSNVLFADSIDKFLSNREGTK